VTQLTSRSRAASLPPPSLEYIHHSIDLVESKYKNLNYFSRAKSSRFQVAKHLKRTFVLERNLGTGPRKVSPIDGKPHGIFNFFQFTRCRSGLAGLAEAWICCCGIGVGRRACGRLVVSKGCHTAPSGRGKVHRFTFWNFRGRSDGRIVIADAAGHQTSRSAPAATAKSLAVSPPASCETRARRTRL